LRIQHIGGSEGRAAFSRKRRKPLCIASDKMQAFAASGEATNNSHADAAGAAINNRCHQVTASVDLRVMRTIA
jgi:hypothetical protein